MVDQDLFPDRDAAPDLVLGPGVERRDMRALPRTELRLAAPRRGQRRLHAVRASRLAAEQPQRADEDMPQCEIRIAFDCRRESGNGIAEPAEIFLRRLSERGAAPLRNDG